MAKLILVDETQVDIQSDYVIVDDTYEFNTSVADYTALAQLSDKLNDENMATVKMVDPFNNEVIYRNLTMASPRFIIVKENDFEIVVTLRMKEKSEQVAQMDTIVEVAQRFDDEQALRVKSIYPQWDTLVGKQCRSIPNLIGMMCCIKQNNLICLFRNSINRVRLELNLCMSVLMKLIRGPMKTQFHILEI